MGNRIKKMKKYLSLLLTFVMILTLWTPVTATAASNGSDSSTATELEVGESKKLHKSGFSWSTTWESSDETVVEVSSNGTVTGISPGEATVTASSRSFGWIFTRKEKVHEFDIIVAEGEEAETIEIGIGENVDLDAPSRGTTTWTSSNKDVATVSDSGTVTGVSAGETTVTVKTRTGGFHFWFISWGGTTTTTEYHIVVVDNGETPDPDPEPTPDPDPEPGITEYTVTFESNGGSEVEAQVIAEGEKVTEPEDPMREGFNFEDWYLDAELTLLYDFESPVTEDITLYAEWTEIIEEPSGDDDGDGISNLMEKAFDLSGETDDTDGDGIDDYSEIYMIGSDPTVDDSSEDKDNDGLSNYDEVMTYGTDATLSDTDLDGLSDGDEINIHGTDPLKNDTDGDSLCDGKEIEIGTDPLSADSSFKITQEAENDDSVVASVDIELSGEQVDTLEISPVENTLFFPEDMPGYLGMAYDFSVEGNFESATICFEFDTAILENGADPAIFYFNETNQTLEELDTIVEGNIASAVVEHFSTYILIDRKVYYNSFEWEDVWDTEGEGSYTGVEIVFAIDDSGSMGSVGANNDPNNERLSVACDLIDSLPDNSKIGIVWFAEEGKLLTPVLSDDREGCKALLTTDYFKAEACNHTSMYDGVNLGFTLFESTSDATLKILVVLSDGVADDTSLHNSTITTAVDKNIKIYSVGLGNSTNYFNSYMKPLAEETGGSFYLASNANELASIYKDINKRIDLEADADGDGIPDYYEDNMFAFNGKQIQLDKNNADTDSDNVPDGEEIEVQLIYNEDNTKVYVKGKMWSDPTLKDTDYDGVRDDLEADRPERMDNEFSGRMQGFLDIERADYTFDYRQFFKSQDSFSNIICSSSLILANTIYNDCGFDYDFGKTTTSIKELMEYHGFEEVIDYKIADGYNQNGISIEKYTDDDLSEIGIGYHEVSYKGETKTILAVVIRGTNGSIEEWSSNFDIGNTENWEAEYHKGFYTAEQRIEYFVSQYVSRYLNDAENLTYWITGHSRGAALSNILAARLIDQGNVVFAYTFATPTTTISNSKNDSKYNSIFNFANTSDIVTYVPLKEWNFGCFGITKYFSIEDEQLEDEWSDQTGVSEYNAMNKNIISLATSRIANSCCESWDQLHDRAGAQNIDDEQYGYISERAKRYCDLIERKSILGNHKGYTLYPSTAFVLQLGAEMFGGSEEEKNNVISLLPELWNSKYAVVGILLLGDAYINKDLFEGLEIATTLLEHGHAPATYYVWIHNG